MTTFLDEEFDPPSAEIQFSGLQPVFGQKTEWESGKLSARAVYGGLNQSQRRQLINALQVGLVRAYTTQAFVEWHHDEDEHFAEVATFLGWLKARRHSGRSGKAAIHGSYVVPMSFWNAKHATNCDWTGSVGLFDEAAMADWKAGIFASIYSRALDMPWADKDLDGIIGVTTLYDVRFDEKHIKTTLGWKEGKAPQRPAKYNWEGAIAAFAGYQQKHDIIPDFYAYGAQATIEKWLANWFDLKGYETPSEASCRSKASMILEAYQEADKE